MIIWYEKGNTMLNLAERWGKKIWKFYQENPEELEKIEEQKQESKREFELE